MDHYSIYNNFGICFEFVTFEQALDLQLVQFVNNNYINVFDESNQMHDEG